MLEQILDYIHNYFVKSINYGKYTIIDGSIDLSFLKDDQYFKIVGSDLNDGVYRYPTSDLVDEEFDGQIWAMAVPRAVIALSDEVEEWVNKHGDVLDSPFSSESFGGYSYTKSSGSSSGGNGDISWMSKFSNRLNHWRKIS